MVPVQFGQREPEIILLRRIPRSGLRGASLVCLVERDEPDEQNKPEEPDQPIPPVSPQLSWRVGFSLPAGDTEMNRNCSGM